MISASQSSGTPEVVTTTSSSPSTRAAQRWVQTVADRSGRRRRHQRRSRPRAGRGRAAGSSTSTPPRTCSRDRSRLSAMPGP
ncbi:MAG TPA: hypothetical protein VFU54_19530 [Actinomycetota bacterium]|nr:hypothetical protein [Actinomycetota bacterium]